MRTPLLLAVLSCLGTLPLNARAALIITSGTLHASAAATNSPNSATDNPPDKSLELPSTSISADAMASGMFGTSQAHVDATVGQSSDGIISIDANTFITGHGSGYAAGAGATGSIAFTQTTSETLAASVTSPNTIFGFGNITVRDSLADNVLQIFISGTGSFDQSKTATLSPGDYTLSWQYTAQPSTGQGGPSSMHATIASVPEPSALGLFVLFGSLMGAGKFATRHPRQLVK